MDILGHLENNFCPLSDMATQEDNRLGFDVFEARDVIQRDRLSEYLHVCCRSFQVVLLLIDISIVYWCT